MWAVYTILLTIASIRRRRPSALTTECLIAVANLGLGVCCYSCRLRVLASLWTRRSRIWPLACIIASSLDPRATALDGESRPCRASYVADLVSLAHCTWALMRRQFIKAWRLPHHTSVYPLPAANA